MIPWLCGCVQTPMDLGTINKKLERNKYSSPQEVFADLRLIWGNCKVFNEEGSEVYTGCLSTLR